MSARRDGPIPFMRTRSSIELNGLSSTISAARTGPIWIISSSCDCEAEFTSICPGPQPLELEGGIGVAVGAGVTVGVGVFVGVGSGVGVAVGKSVGDGTGVSVGAGTAVGVGSGNGVEVGVGCAVGVGSAVGVGVAVGSTSAGKAARVGKGVGDSSIGAGRGESGAKARGSLSSVGVGWVCSRLMVASCEGAKVAVGRGGMVAGPQDRTKIMTIESTQAAGSLVLRERHTIAMNPL